MKLQPLYDLQQEINRLFIAGSRFAKGDPRLQKHIPILQKLGEKAPVFTRLASDIDDLLKADSQQSAEKLTAISTLLYSVLYTQGETIEPDAAEREQTPNISLGDIRTEYSYLQLKPVIQALTVSNPGRMEVLRDAMEQKIFNDSRSYQYLDTALGDKYSELCDYVEETIIPTVGKPVTPFLLQNFRYEDRTENVRRLRLLAQFRPDLMPAMTEKILSEALPSLQAEAVTILSADPANEPLIIKLADDKNKAVRESAYNALARLNTSTSLEKLLALYAKNKTKPNNLSALAGALGSTKTSLFFKEIFEQVTEAFHTFIEMDASADEKLLLEKLNLFEIQLEALKNKDDKSISVFLSDLLKNKTFQQLTAKKKTLGGTVQSIYHTVIAIINTFEPAKKLAFYEENIQNFFHSDWHDTFWDNYIHAAVGHYSSKKFFEIFHQPVTNKLISIRNLYNVFIVDSQDGWYDYNFVFKDNLIDEHWAFELYPIFSGKLKWDWEYNLALRIIHHIEKKDKKLNDLLVDLAKKVSPLECGEIFRLLLIREAPKRFDVIFSAMEKLQKNSYSWQLNQLSGKNFWNQFPKEYAEKFRKLYDTNKLDIFQEIADEIER
ncbi:MAG: HEAT repeat domain-containing protein [Bacteroidales bacterium]|jgi:hypothetical protein|nr:HEAT repeat domain-containing protein [Bacteroidales bacterium]